MTIVRIVSFALLFITPLWGMTYPSLVKRSVTFLFARDTAGRLQPQGTGFFVLMNAAQGSDTVSFGYLVTSRTAVQRPTGEFLDTLYLRLNRKDGYSDTLLIQLSVNGVRRFEPHPDSTVDLVVIPAYPDIQRYDLLYIPMTMIAAADYLGREKVAEGTPLFHVGMLEEHLGTFKNLPAVRFGTIVQFSEEKYRWNGLLTEFYLLEPGVSAAATGAPVYHYADAVRDTSGVVKPVRLAVCGIVAGGFRNGERYTETARVTPSYKLNELLMSRPVAAEREKEFLRRRGNSVPK